MKILNIFVTYILIGYLLVVTVLFLLLVFTYYVIKLGFTKGVILANNLIEGVTNESK